ncbi:hypothetical protein K1T71_013991 [Dendrolimus kikuchii]|uniref:Uncharacterized protein n=1 Tax=Dendrolimus kikuchii TaxID=765133 RepID=A0ACC1CGI5_9NEOP|nr:hypothetical protein K1T71_013991 [Dendrolimus kikuchii]
MDAEVVEGHDTPSMIKLISSISSFFRYLPPQQAFSAAAPSPVYGTPGFGQLRQTNALFSRIQAPGSEYGVPNPAQVYGAPGFGLTVVILKEPANYSFEYMVKDDQSGNDFGHRETRLGDRAEGLYYVLLPDGRKQTVEYEADQGGYKPRISYEDTGLGLAAYRNALGYNAYNTAGGPY